MGATDGASLTEPQWQAVLAALRAGAKPRIELQFDPNGQSWEVCRDCAQVAFWPDAHQEWCPIRLAQEVLKLLGEEMTDANR